MAKKHHIYGKKPKGNRNVKKMSAIFIAHPNLPQPPISCDWTDHINNFGMMMNDTLGCCTCAAVFHARQIWTANTKVEDTEADRFILQLYEEACGYKPNDPNTDQGGVEQDVLHYIQTVGVPLANGARDKILGFAEVNKNNLDEVKLAISEFGLAYIGFQVPDSIYDSNGEPLPIWNVSPIESNIEGGHAVILVGYDANGLTVISWGQKYIMSWNFFQKYVDEVYAIVDNNWIKSTGVTPLGLSIPALESLMTELK